MTPIRESMTGNPPEPGVCSNRAPTVYPIRAARNNPIAAETVSKTHPLRRVQPTLIALSSRQASAKSN
jgi:hypothetical protein